MKISITADLHLKESNNKEKYDALKDIILKSQKHNISNIIIAGDLFDGNYSNYSDFEKNILLYYKDIIFHVIPGNHDFKLKQKYFISENIIIYETSQIVNFENVKFLFIPYSNDCNISDEIEKNQNNLEQNQWYLITHSDFIDSSVPKNIHENKLYMPISRKDIERFLPSKVISGHIHKPYKNDYIYYIGSPYPLDINETGIRRFLLFDTTSLNISSMNIKTKIFFNEKVFMVPSSNELSYLENKINLLKKSWGLSKEEYKQVILRFEILGFTNDKEKIYKFTKKLFDDVTFEKDIIINNLKISENDGLDELTSKVINNLEKIKIPKEISMPNNEDIIKKSLELIYLDK